MKTSRANLQPRCNLELVHVGEPGKQHRRDEGVRAREEERVELVFVEHACPR